MNAPAKDPQELAATLAEIDAIVRKLVNFSIVWQHGKVHADLELTVDGKTVLITGEGDDVSSALDDALVKRANRLAAHGSRVLHLPNGTQVGMVAGEPAELIFVPTPIDRLDDDLTRLSLEYGFEVFATDLGDIGAVRDVWAQRGAA